jgi:crossover junction endodeoxyribonuclease RuvC
VALAHNELEISEYSALEIKRSITGTGRASKQQVQHMVRVLLGLDRKPPQDAADALACAICHVHLAQVRKRQESAMSELADRDSGGVRR